MRKLVLSIMAFSAFAIAKPGDMYMANIEAIEVGKPADGKVPVTVKFVRKCYENVLGTVAKDLRLILAQVHQAVGVVLMAGDSDCYPVPDHKGELNFSVDRVAGDSYRFDPILQNKPKDE